MNVAPDSVTRARRLFAGAGVAVFIAAGMMMTPAPAFADEFTVGIVVDRATSESKVSTFMEGFQLAVDQSPDVSHPPDVEGGDHLGSMDVVMVVVDSESELDELLAAALELVEIDRLPIIVVDVPPEILASLVGSVADAGTMVIAMTDAGSGESAQTPLLFAASEQDGIELLTDRTPAFEEAFLAKHGRPSSPAAARGYLAGRLVDISVEATDRNPFATDTLVAALVEATTARPTSAAVVAEGGSAADTPGSSVDEGRSVLALVAVVGMVVAAAVHVYWAAGGMWPGSDRSDLARKVVGSTDEFPSTVMTLGVAALLIVGAILVGGATGLWALPASGTLVRAASWVVGFVLVLRGIVGLILSGRRQASGRGTAFSIRDLVIYSPLTLLLGAFTVFALLSTT